MWMKIVPSGNSWIEDSANASKTIQMSVARLVSKGSIFYLFVKQNSINTGSKGRRCSKHITLSRGILRVKEGLLAEDICFVPHCQPRSFRLECIDTQTINSSEAYHTNRANKRPAPPDPWRHLRNSDHDRRDDRTWHFSHTRPGCTRSAGAMADHPGMVAWRGLRALRGFQYRRAMHQHSVHRRLVHICPSGVWGVYGIRRRIR